MTLGGHLSFPTSGARGIDALILNQRARLELQTKHKDYKLLVYLNRINVIKISEDNGVL